MKISKLFHWLYALLMFLPLFVFLPTCFYYAFNENALTPIKQVENTTTIHMQQNVINGKPLTTNNWTIEDVDGASYLDYDLDNGMEVHFANSSECYININVDDTNINDNDKLLICYYLGAEENISNVLSITFYFDNYENQVINFTTSFVKYQSIFTLEHTDTVILVEAYPNNYVGVIYIKNVELINLTQMFGSGNEPTIDEFNALFPNDYYAVDSNATAKVPNGTYTTYPSISDAVALAWTDVWHNDLFSWSYNSFLTVPFTYLTNLFSIPSDNVVIYCFSYWLTISIVWLCFDVIIYVPQIAHRWLDKASLE